jgi:hypothetical protein
MIKQPLPFLLRFAKKCVSPGRYQLNEEYEYDALTDMVLWVADKSKPFVIDKAGQDGPMTKKCDLEKGDDNKDRRMWQ